MQRDDARDGQIANGARVRISTAIASLEVEAEISPDVVRGSVNYPHGWGHKGGWRRAGELPGVHINLLALAPPGAFEPDRKRVVSGKSGSVRVGLGGRRPVNRNIKRRTRETL